MDAIDAECATLDDWFHCDDPITNSETYLLLIQGLVQLKDDRQAALRVHDHDRSARLLAEIRDSTRLCAAAAEALDRQRARWLAAGQLWPLARL